MIFQGIEISTWQLTLLVLIALWSIPWKGYALWLAAQKGQKWWFVTLLVVNTVGLLEIFYIFYFSRRGEKKKDRFPLSRE